MSEPRDGHHDSGADWEPTYGAGNPGADVPQGNNPATGDPQGSPGLGVPQYYGGQVPGNEGQVPADAAGMPPGSPGAGVPQSGGLPADAPVPPGSPGAWQPGWVPPAAYPPGGSTGWGPGWTPPPQHRRRALPLALGAVLLVGGAAAGVGIGHAAWHSGSTNNTAATSPANPGQGDTEVPSNPGGQGSNGFPYGNGNSGNGNSGNGNSGTGNSGNSNSSGGPSDVSKIAAKVNPALVDVNVTFGYQNAQGAGTGIVLTSKGEILTNNHVIDGATSISVTDVGNGKTYTASVVGYDSTHDLAVLQLKNASGLQTATIGDSSKISVGQSVVAIGNAGGSGGTPTSAGGSITALNQSITANDELDGASEKLTGLIEVNANVQSGDSGGSLVDTSGKVIGVDTAASDQYSFQGSGGQGYAVPINQAMSVVKTIESGTGNSTVHVGGTAFLGVTITSSDSSTGVGNGALGNGGSTVSGAQVSDVLNGGTAEQAGLTAGDVITKLGGTTISSSSDLSKVMTGHHPGDKVSLSWVDTAGKSHTATVSLGSGPPA